MSHTVCRVTHAMLSRHLPRQGRAVQESGAPIWVSSHNSVHFHFLICRTGMKYWFHHLIGHLEDGKEHTSGHREALAADVPQSTCGESSRKVKPAAGFESCPGRFQLRQLPSPHALAFHLETRQCLNLLGLLWGLNAATQVNQTAWVHLAQMQPPGTVT